MGLMAILIMHMHVFMKVYSYRHCSCSAVVEGAQYATLCVYLHTDKYILDLLSQSIPILIVQIIKNHTS